MGKHLNKASSYFNAGIKPVVNLSWFCILKRVLKSNHYAMTRPVPALSTVHLTTEAMTFKGD